MINEVKYNKRILLGLLLGWMVINFIQAALTGLFDDEALFWMYGQHPAWGYYEHPPMVGILIRAGYILFHNEFGVRFFFVIINTLSFYLVARLSGVKDPVLFAALGFTTVIAQVGGFMAAPDVALLFFTILFFLVYKNLLEKDSILMAVLWGMIMAAMIYSKYNGILVILFTIMSNFRILKSRSFYIAVASGILCMVPHIIWSFQNDHPTVYYHLFERSFEQFNLLKYFSEYFVGQFLIYGPFMAFVFFWAMIVFRPKNIFDKSLKFTAIGFILFFMAYTFRGKVEPNWTVPAFAPLLIMAYSKSAEKIKLRKWIMPLALISLLFAAGLRVYLVYDYLKFPRSLVNLSELYGWKEWSEEVAAKAGDRPVLFLNSYQRTSKYIFYTGKPAYTMEDYSGHRTQYYYWSDIEKSLQGKDIMVIDFLPWRWLPDRKEFTGSNGITTYYGFWGNFRSHYKLGLKFKLQNLRFPVNSSVTLPITILNPYHDTVRFNENKWMPGWLVYHIHYKDKFLAQMVPSTDITNMVIAGATRDTSIRFMTPSQPGNYYFWVSVSNGWVPPARNMNYQMMEIY
ncbi:MAG: glycosyltransferase family 39 protein [Bacteroidetes bacterium]|nr:glycosyltransferase family 39 protein [Bacteroidota bacterium]